MGRLPAGTIDSGEKKSRYIYPLVVLVPRN